MRRRMGSLVAVLAVAVTAGGCTLTGPIRGEQIVDYHADYPHYA